MNKLFLLLDAAYELFARILSSRLKMISENFLGKEEMVAGLANQYLLEFSYYIELLRSIANARNIKPLQIMLKHLVMFTE